MKRPSTIRALALPACAALGALGSLGAWRADPPRFWGAWITAFLFLQTLMLGCLFQPALEHLVGARWSVPLRRVPERLGTLAWPLLPASLLTLGALGPLYPGWPGTGGKAAWMSPGAMAFRVALAALLCALSARILGPRSGSPAGRSRFAPAFMAIFALVLTQAAYDWVGGITPAWYSDLLGVYLAAGSFLAGFAATTLGTLRLRGQGRLPGLGADHLHNLGAWMFAFTAFWGYIAYAHYLLMWYGNLPDEAGWYRLRLEGGWLQISQALALLRFGLPFALLLPRAAKSDARRLAWAAGLLLGGHLLDMAWLILPSIGLPLRLGWMEVSVGLFMGSMALGWWARADRMGADLPEGDPALAQGLAFRL
ncbi:MAG TPA: hypothetical protein VK188_11290 [Holophaga sp.]|nr:hypothetical protein [Holophaga sp.]